MTLESFIKSQPGVTRTSYRQQRSRVEDATSLHSIERYGPEEDAFLRLLSAYREKLSFVDPGRSFALPYEPVGPCLHLALTYRPGS